MDLKTLKTLHDKAYNHGQVPREQASDDLVFYYVTQWDDNLLGESQLQYRGQFDIVRKAGRQIIGDLRGNPVQVDFQPINDTREDAADLLDGLYLSDDRCNSSIESYDVAQNEMVVCGVGGWILYTEYESMRSRDKQQVIKRKPIYEAVNTMFWDPNAKLADKSDADYVSVLHAYSEDGYKNLCEELTGKECDSNASFAFPEESYSFPWVAEDKKIHVVEFYHREKFTDKILTFTDIFGDEKRFHESEINEVMDELIDNGFNLEDEEDVERYKVTKYIASGEKILKSEVINCEYIPVVPCYGERAYIEGEEYYEGVTRLAKDPQRLRNFQLSYLADIVSRSPRPKPIFTPEQIQGYEDMYSESGSDNNYPYLLQNSVDSQGNPLPIGPISQLPEQNVPTALIQAIELSRQAVEDVANPGLPQDIADPDLSGKAVLALQNRVDQQSIVYQQNMKHAKRRDGQIYASMASSIYDQPKEVTVTSPDGSRSKATLMEQVVDAETGEIVTLNDLTSAEFEVYSDVGPSYTSKKEQTLEMLSGMMQSIDPADPMRRFIMLEMVNLTDGTNLDGLRDYAKRELLAAGVRKPESEEDEAYLASIAQQGQQPDANMVLAMAEQQKAEAQVMREQRQALKDQADIANNQGKLQVDVFKAQTDRMNTQIDAREAQANIQNKNIDSFGKRVDTLLKAGQSLRASATPAL
ncbi:MAG: portal protein [Rickettsiales bacterium]